LKNIILQRKKIAPEKKQKHRSAIRLYKYRTKRLVHTALSILKLSVCLREVEGGQFLTDVMMFSQGLTGTRDISVEG